LVKAAIKDAENMKSSTIAGHVAAFLCLGVATPLFAAEPLVTGTANLAVPEGKLVFPATKPAETCLNDLSTFHTEMQKDGYWLGGSSDAYGYPVGDAGYGYGYEMGPYPSATVGGYPNARPGYEIGTLIATANILARHGEQQPCEDVLATVKNIYTLYVADLRGGGAPRVGEPRWQQQEIAEAQPVTNNSNSFRSDQLLGTDVRTPQNEALGSVDDFVMSPETGKIAYLVIARGGIFGIGEKYVPVPWEDFKVTPKANLLVLNSTKSTMDGAPQVTHDQSMTPEQFNQEVPKVDAYWKTHLSEKSSN
jgi:sporulation protein YlmC with PRC-barrel domain